ncbi:hypothetical protein PAECIP111802_06917 [Paenibacillus allorhizosphaerae]|uniref:Uncharacterized protein n=1 Tax=Paenibacillus allorhizosphaerae TaxID=2849866 RepID=A0ABM8VTV7_9BACL|nr:hypothetical protein PAECIP111802_06917 [Paenibacillus allorhizosphaerae]
MEEDLWVTLLYILEQIIPVAEQCDIKRRYIPMTRHGQYSDCRGL